MSIKDENEPPVEETDQRRRELLNMMKNVAIAGPILLTLKNTPALAAAPGAGGSCISDNPSAHADVHKHAYDSSECVQWRNRNP